MDHSDRSPPVDAARRPAPLSAFQSDAVAIEERPPPPLARMTLHAIVLLAVTLAVWASIAEVDRIVAASGRLITTKPLIVVQPLETGVVRSIEVSVGSVVREGELLATLDPTFVTADATGLEEKLESLTAEADRLRNEIDGTPFDAPPGNRARAFQAQLREQRMAEYQSRLASLDSAVARLESNIASNRETQDSLRERLRVVNQIVAMREELLRRDVGSQLQVMEARLNQLNIKEQLATKAAEGREMLHNLEKAKSERDSFVQEWTRVGADKFLAVTREIDATTQELAKAKRRSNLVDLRAPADGVVLEIAQRSVGSVARGADSLITLVPLNVPLEVEAEVKAADIGRIRTGDPVRLKLEALPYQQYGHLDGRVRVVSEDSFRPESDKTRTIYRSRISIERENLRDVPADFRLIPGMTMSAEIVIGRRTIISYFLHPILRVFDESLREP